MQNQMRFFNHEDFGELGVLMIDGQPYFTAVDCAEKLGYRKPHDAVSRHCRYSVKHGVPHPQSVDKTIEKIFIPESDLYRLIIRSKLPEAVKFEAFVCDTVLPSIRKYGGYVTDGALDNFIDNPEAAMDFFTKLKAEREKKAELEKRVKDAEPKVRYFDTILQCPEAVQVSIIAKDYGYSAMTFNRLLHAYGFQFKVGKTWILYQDYADKGYAVSRTYRINETLSVVHTCFTQKGRFFIYNLLKKEGILPLTERTENTKQTSLDDEN